MVRKLPKLVYVAWREDSDEPYLIADRVPDTFEEGDRVGVYKQLSVKTLHITRELK